MLELNLVVLINLKPPLSYKIVAMVLQTNKISIIESDQQTQ